jgi:hypothetical protein
MKTIPMYYIWIVGINLKKESNDRANLVRAIWEIDDVLSRSDMEFRLRQNVINVTLPFGSNRRDVLDWRQSHLPDLPVVVVSRSIGQMRPASHHARMQILNGPLLDDLQKSDECQRMFGWFHRGPCLYHQALGQLLHCAGHAAGYLDSSGSFMSRNAFKQFPRGVRSIGPPPKERIGNDT